MKVAGGNPRPRLVMTAQKQNFFKQSRLLCVFSTSLYSVWIGFLHIVCSGTYRCCRNSEGQTKQSSTDFVSAPFCFQLLTIGDLFVQHSPDSHFSFRTRRRPHKNSNGWTTKVHCPKGQCINWLVQCCITLCVLRSPSLFEGCSNKLFYKARFLS